MMSSSSSNSQPERVACSERTLAIIKPEAYVDREAIKDAIIRNNFMILAERLVRLTPEQTAEFYRSHYGRQHFPHLVAHVSGGPIVVMALAGRDAIQRWKTLIGPARVEEAQAYWPDSLRARYGRRTDHGDYFNGLHGSENYAEAIRELHFFFPNMLIGPVPRLWQIKDYIQKNLRATLVPALTQLAHEKPAEPILWLADRLRRHNPNEPEFAPQPADLVEETKCYTPNPSQASNFN